MRSQVSFEFENQLAVSIEDLCAHLVKDQRYQTGHFNVRIKDKSAASNGEGRTFFGGVLTITMDVWGANEPEVRYSRKSSLRNHCVPRMLISTVFPAHVPSWPIPPDLQHAVCHAQHERSNVWLQGRGPKQATQGAVQRMHGRQHAIVISQCLDGLAAIATACRIRWKHVNISCPGTQCKHSEILSFFDEVFGAKYKMGKIQVEPNSVFSATDNAVMDPAYGIHIEGLVNCLKSSKLVEHYKEQVMITHVTPDGCNRVHSAAGCWNDAKIRGGHTVASRARPH